MKTFTILLFGFWTMINVAYAQEGGKMDRWNCGQPMTDPRDNKVYNTVMIGTQCFLVGQLVSWSVGQLAVGQSFSFFNRVSSFEHRLINV